MAVECRVARLIPLEKFHFDVTLSLSLLSSPEKRKKEKERGGRTKWQGGSRGNAIIDLGRGRVTLCVSVEDRRTPSLPFQTPLSLVRFASNCNIFTPGAQSTLMQSCLRNIVSRLLKVAEMETGGCRCLFGVMGRRKSQGAGAGIAERVVGAGLARMALWAIFAA